MDFKTKLEKRKKVVLKSLDQCYIEQTGEIHMRHNKPGFVEISEQLMRILVGDKKRKAAKTGYRQTAAAATHKQLVATSNRDFDMRFQNNLRRIVFVNLKKLKRGEDRPYACIKAYQEYYPSRKDKKFFVGLADKQCGMHPQLIHPVFFEENKTIILPSLL